MFSLLIVINSYLQAAGRRRRHASLGADCTELQLKDVSTAAGHWRDDVTDPAHSHPQRPCHVTALTSSQAAADVMLERRALQPQLNGCCGGTAANWSSEEKVKFNDRIDNVDDELHRCSADQRPHHTISDPADRLQQQTAASCHEQVEVSTASCAEVRNGGPEPRSVAQHHQQSLALEGTLPDCSGYPQLIASWNSRHSGSPTGTGFEPHAKETHEELSSSAAYAQPKDCPGLVLGDTAPTSDVASTDRQRGLSRACTCGCSADEVAAGDDVKCAATDKVDDGQSESSSSRVGQLVEHRQDHDDVALLCRSREDAAGLSLHHYETSFSAVQRQNDVANWTNKEAAEDGSTSPEVCVILPPVPPEDELADDIRREAITSIHQPVLSSTQSQTVSSSTDSVAGCCSASPLGANDFLVDKSPADMESTHTAVNCADDLIGSAHTVNDRSSSDTQETEVAYSVIAASPHSESIEEIVEASLTASAVDYVDVINCIDSSTACLRQSQTINSSADSDADAVDLPSSLNNNASTSSSAAIVVDRGFVELSTVSTEIDRTSESTVSSLRTQTDCPSHCTASDDGASGSTSEALDCDQALGRAWNNDALIQSLVQSPVVNSSTSGDADPLYLQRDVARSAESLHELGVTAETSIKPAVSCVSDTSLQGSSCTQAFDSATLTPYYNGIDDSVDSDSSTASDGQSLDAKSHYTKSAVASTRSVSRLSMLETDGKPVFGVACLSERLYVVCRQSSSLLVYSAVPPFHLLQHLPVPGLTDPWDVAACSRAGVLYVADLAGGVVWRVSPRTDGGADCRPWVDDVERPWTLSVTPDSSRLIVVSGTASVVVYDVDGRRLETVTLPDDVRNPLHAVETPSGSLIVSHGLLSSDGAHSVSELVGPTAAGSAEPRWRVTKSYGGGERLREPWYVTLVAADSADSESRVCVADSRHSRLLLLDFQLRHDATIQTTNYTETSSNVSWGRASRPWRICYVPDKRLLLVGFYTGGAAVFTLEKALHTEVSTHTHI